MPELRITSNVRDKWQTQEQVQRARCFLNRMNGRELLDSIPGSVKFVQELLLVF